MSGARPGGAVATSGHPLPGGLDFDDDGADNRGRFLLGGGASAVDLVVAGCGRSTSREGGQHGAC